MPTPLTPAVMPITERVGVDGLLFIAFSVAAFAATFLPGREVKNFEDAMEGVLSMPHWSTLVQIVAATMAIVAGIGHTGRTGKSIGWAVAFPVAAVFTGFAFQLANLFSALLGF